MQATTHPVTRPDWSTWAAFLREHRLDGLAAWLLEAAGPLTLLVAQFLYVGGPLFRPTFTPLQINGLARLLEDPQQARDFAAFLREEGPA
jgi:hypothetical protein